MSLADKIVNQNADGRTIGQIIADESEDLRDGWVIEANNKAKDAAVDKWEQFWETAFIEDDEEADRTEKQYALRGEEYLMKPRPFLDLLEVLKQLRPDTEEWVDYRFRNASTGVIVYAWLLK